MQDSSEIKTGTNRSDRQLSSDKDFDKVVKKQKTDSEHQSAPAHDAEIEASKPTIKAANDSAKEMNRECNEEDETNNADVKSDNPSDHNESLNSQHKTYVMKRARKWELKPVRIANVWDYAGDVVVHQWVRAKEERSPLEEAIPRDPNVYKVYRCKYPECGKTFRDPVILKKHSQMHGDKQTALHKYACPVEGCGKKFLDNSKLRRHQLVHTGEKPFKCDVCGKLFSLDFNMRTHMRTHTDCNKRFTQSSNLVSHERMHYSKEIKGVDTGVVSGTGPNED